MATTRNIIARFMRWLSDAPRVEHPAGWQVSLTWLTDVLPGGDLPSELVGQASASTQRPLVPDLRQCEPWRGASALTPVPRWVEPHRHREHDPEAARAETRERATSTVPLPPAAPRTTETGA